MPEAKSYIKYASLTKLEDEAFENSTMVFDVEEVLLKSFSMFPCFMLVAFEGGGLLRALILLLLYPFLCLLREGVKLKAIVFISFFGVKTKTFNLGKTVLPKFFLDNVGQEGFEVVMKFSRKVACSRLPRIMVEGFLRDYLGVEDIIGVEIVDFCGYYIGLFDNLGEEQDIPKAFLANMESNNVVGIGGERTRFKTSPFVHCKDIYLVSKEDKKKWRNLPKDKYVKPLIFHDGRIAFEPTPLNTLVMFIWLPFGIILNITRTVTATLLPYKLSTPIISFLGIHIRSSTYDHVHHTNKVKNSGGVIYVCNHKTVLDPVYVSQILQSHLSAVTYSISQTTATISPIKTLNLTRDKEKDAEIMRNALSKGDLVVCPEGTTCREPYLLRFSPLFAEISDNIIPVALEAKVDMFYGTTATGIKALDPSFVLLNPKPFYYIKFLEKLPKKRTCRSGGATRFEVANYVQAEIGKALGYKCTKLTRRDKYAILAGNDGLVNKKK